MKNLSFFNKIIYLLNSVFATLLLLSFFLPYISPKTIPFFAILSLFVPILIFLNLFFVIYWILKLKKQFLLSTFVLVLNLFFYSPVYKISGKKSSFNSDLKVMSYNVKSFDLFKNQEENNKFKDGYDFIQSKNLDILLIQEFYQSSKLKIDFPYEYVKKTANNGQFGLAIYSKFKIINTGSLDLKNTSNNIIFADIIKDKDTIRIYNLHLESLKIKPNEENFGEENSEKLFHRMSTSFQKQAEQTDLFLIHEQNWKGKKIIGGDFNNTAYSWVYKQIATDKKDAFIEAGKGFGKTYDYFLPTRIDYILTDKDAIINSFTNSTASYSDHFPIISKINW